MSKAFHRSCPCRSSAFIGTAQVFAQSGATKHVRHVVHAQANKRPAGRRVRAGSQQSVTRCHLAIQSGRPSPRSLAAIEPFAFGDVRCWCPVSISLAGIEHLADKRSCSHRFAKCGPLRAELLIVWRETASSGVS